jgi:BMFP domain-containing protein YqiC
MLQTKNVFIDTEIYVRNQFNFENAVFSSFREACASEELTHITTSTVKKEVDRKIDKSIQTALNALNTFQRNAQTLMSLHDKELSPLFNTIKEEDVYAKAKKIYLTYLKDCNTQTAFAHEIDGEDILNRYFTLNAPFTKDKSNEFRDAISLSSLKTFLDGEYDEKSYVVSSDKALETYCADDNRLIYVESLSKLLDIYNLHTNTRASKVKEYVLEIEDKIKEKIKDYVNNCDVYNVSTWEDAEVEEFSVISVGDPDPSVVNINDEECQITFDISIEMDVTVTGPDYNNGTYDKEEGIIYTHGNSSRKSRLDLEFSVELDINYEFTNGELSNVSEVDVFINDAYGGIEVDIEENEPDYY